MMISIHVIGTHSSKLLSNYANSVKSVLLFPSKLVTIFLISFNGDGHTHQKSNKYVKYTKSDSSREL